MPDRVVACHDCTEVAPEGEHLERHLDGRAALHRDDAQVPLLAPESFEHADDPGERRHLAVDGHVVRAIDVHELVGPLLVELDHLGVYPVTPDVRHQDLVWDDTVEHRSGGVTERLENQAAGVDEGAVEIEEDRAVAHRLDATRAKRRRRSASVLDPLQVETPRRRGRAGLRPGSSVEEAPDVAGLLLEHGSHERPDHVT